MDNELVADILRLVQAMSWPDEIIVGGESERRYRAATDLLLMYRGDPALLYEALHMLAECGSQPYAYAGIAKTLMSAAYEQGFTHDPIGLAEATSWLRRAQEKVGNCVEINYLDAALYMCAGNMRSARLVLDYFQKHKVELIYICFAEMQYWIRLSQIAEMERWFRRANTLSQEPIHRLWALSALADGYMADQKWDSCIQTYNLAITLFPEDPWVWHNLSIAYIRVRNFQDAVRCNQKALSIMQFPAALEIEETLLKRIGRL